jgi:hypothetical protein
MINHPEQIDSEIAPMPVIFMLVLVLLAAFGLIFGKQRPSPAKDY